MYSTGKLLDQQKPLAHVYKEFLETILYTIVHTYILSILIKSRDMAVNLITYGINNDKLNHLNISRSVSNESDSAYSDSSCENSSIPDGQQLDYSSESYTSLEFSESNSRFISSFSEKSSLTPSCDLGTEPTCVVPPCQEESLSGSSVHLTKQLSHQVFSFNETTVEPENVEIKETSITPSDLVYLINNSESCLLLDCRSFMTYNANHIVGSFNVGCSDRITKKRLMDGKIQIVDVICGPEGKEMYRMLAPNAHIIVYDDSTVDLKGLAATQPLKILTECLQKQGRPFKYLQGGLQAFQLTYSGMCTNPEQVSSLPILFSPTSPELNVDIDAAVVSEILPHVLIGNQRDAADREKLRELGVSHVINVTSQLPLHFENDGVVYKRLPANDSGCQNLKQYFQEAIAFIDAVREAKGRVLVHCQAGVSRSPTIVIAYLMSRSQLTLADAFAFVKERRSIVAPNLNFMGQLLEFEQKSVQTHGLCPPSLSANLLQL